ncbi:MAG TPA: peptidoglycan DD-metalloendopeptidase family protein [Candidatus Paceibacterota bacterium]|nr:peptidoglycan DD-metalloendopeptidase family protein [Candidatus Paceibacterota bacterium]
MLSVPSPTYALTANEIQAKINDHNTQINALQDEIARYQKELDALGAKRSTLESTIQSLTISRQKLTADLAVTQNKIGTENLKLDQLALAIGNKQNIIDAQQSAAASALRAMNEADAVSPFASILDTGRLADVWVEADQIDQFNRALEAHITELANAKADLAVTHDAVAAAKAQLVSLQNDQISQRRSLDANRSTQKTLLAQTRNKESTYQSLIADKQAAEKSFEQELLSLQSQLNLIVHPGSIPKANIGVLSWPFSNTIMQQCAARAGYFGNSYCITQYFGTTPFATANPQIYSGHGHDGVDIGVPIGTPVRAALSGTVLDTGNTDLAHDAAGRQCYSFGKWIMLAHANGLNTMYAHLSEIDVSKGQSVTTGQIIGYSGMTGYATGPHLHFGVYAAEGTKIMTLGQFHGVSGTRCANATMPVATISAYLNPLSYLIN